MDEAHGRRRLRSRVRKLGRNLRRIVRKLLGLPQPPRPPAKPPGAKREGAKREGAKRMGPGAEPPAARPPTPGIKAAAARPRPDTPEILARRESLNASSYNQRRPFVPLPDEALDASEAAWRAAQRPGKRHRIGVLTAVTGDYEQPRRHEHLMPDAAYLVVTDSAIRRDGVARYVAPDYFDIDPVRRARFVKTHPHLYLPGCAVGIWHDANVVIRGDLGPLVDAFLASGRPIGAVPHPLRTDVYQEAEECVLRRKDCEDTIRAHIERYRALGFAHDDLVESNLMMVRLDRRDARAFLAAWWEEIERGSRRDQLSFNHALAKTGIDYFRLTARPDSVRNHPLLALIQHSAIAIDPVAAGSAPATPRPALRPRDRRHDRTVDIVVCVHDAPEVTARCLALVLRHRDPALHRLILVDDGSTAPTAALLEAIARENPAVALIRSAEARGYTRAANQGLRASTGELVILLNSDTEVSAGFAEKLAEAAFAKPGIGIVGPLSNAASGQSIPDHRGAGGQTAINALPAGMTAADVDLWCERHPAARDFPRVALVHGFCFALTRETIDRVGLFDEANFPRGYGEENDYCFRAGAAGVGLAIATHTYVYHAKSQSYGHEERRRLVDRSNLRLVEMYGKPRIRRAVANKADHPTLALMRRDAAQLYPAEAPPAEAEAPQRAPAEGVA